MAAEKALKKLEAQLNCPICLDTYTDPKQLQCHHVYCRQCLVRHVIRDQQSQFILTCPNCRQVTPVPASGVAGLQAAFQINQLLEIVEEHKKAKGAIASAERVEGVSASPASQISTSAGCPEHGGREAVLYCETCDETVCIRCTKKGSKHSDHDYFELDEAFERYKGTWLQPMEKQLETIKRALVQLDTRCEEISNQQATIEANIHDTFARLHQTLDVRKTKLIGQLQQLTQDKLKSLAVQRDQIETTQAQLNSCLHFMRENLKTGNQGEALLMKSTTIRKVKVLTTTFQPDILEPNTEADMTFSASADITTVIQNYGCVLISGPPSYIVSGKALSIAAVEKKSTVLLSFYKLPNKEALDSIMCELVSEMTGTRVGGSVERRGQSQYEISYQPTIKGRHQLHIKVEGQHIRGSPFLVTVMSSAEKFDVPILSVSGLKEPIGVVINQKGEVVVTEGRGHCVSVFSPSRERLQSFCTHGPCQAQLETPNGVAVDSEGCILVTDTDNHRIQKFTAVGRYLEAVGTNGSGPLQFKYPKGIVYNVSNSKVYVADENHCIQILNSDLSYACSFGEKGSGKGQFNNPQHLSCDSTGNVYVADCYNHRIQVFTAEGEFLRMFGKYGQGNGQLNGACGLAIDSSDRVYVSEFNNHRVSAFTSEGQFMTSFGRKGSGPGQFHYPTGLAVDSSGVIYICDCRNGRVQML